MFRKVIIFVAILLAQAVSAQQEPDSLTVELGEVTVGAQGGRRSLHGIATHTEIISASELKRAACCNLGESFTTNPSVDVSYSDAATGARQIRLLGLSGEYVQMLTENVPAFRGAASPFGLGYVPGPWLQSIQVSKGASSVKNGYESVSGQINVEMKKPQADPSLSLNGYVDHRGKAELNADGNLHLSPRWSGALLLHGEHAFKAHDENGDGFTDMPRISQLAAMNRWAYMGERYVFQLAAKGLAERRESGQDTHHMHHADLTAPLYRITIDTRRAEVFTKNAFIFDRDNDGNIALILSGNLHRQEAAYGQRGCDITQRELYASLMFERKWVDLHALSVGVSTNVDSFDYNACLVPAEGRKRSSEHETVTGAYAQYTLNLDSRLIAMAGLRYDYNSRHGSVVTPRLHLRYNPSERWSLHASAGRGYRSPHPLAELNYLLASSRRLVIEKPLPLEAAWNMGIGADHTAWIDGRKLTVGAEYFYTAFTRQMCVSFDRDPHAVYIYGLKGHSRSHTAQVDLTAELSRSLSLSAAWRLTDVRADYGRGMEQKPLASRWKLLFTGAFTPRMGIWQVDVSLAVNGPGRMPRPYVLDDGSMSWAERFPTWCGLNAQATRNFRHWSVYIGGENLTGFRQKHPVIDAANPWGPRFDATMVWGPLHGAVVYAGFRFNITKFN